MTLLNGLLTSQGGITSLTGDVTASGTGSVVATVAGIEGKTLPALADGYLNYNGTSFQYSALPTSLPPSGSAGGALSGSYPNPTINLTSNASITGTLPVTNLVAGTSAQILLNNATPTPTWTTLSQDGYLNASGAVTVTQAQSGALTFGASTGLITLAAADTGPGLLHTALGSLGTPANITITPQAPNGASGSAAQNTPGSVLINLPLPGAVGTAGNEAGFKVERNGTLYASIQGYTSSPTLAALYLGETTPSATNYAIIGGATTQFNGSTGCELQANGGNILIINSTTIAPQINAMTWLSTATGPTISQATPGSVSVPANFTITTQAPNGGSGTKAQNTPGSLIVNTPLIGSVGTSGAPGWLQVQYGGTSVITAGTYTTPNTGIGVLWMGTPAAAPTATNYTIYANGGVAQLNGVLTATLGAGNNYPLIVNGNGAQITSNGSVSSTTTLGSGVGVLGITNATTNPTTTVTGGGVIYSQNAALKWFNGATGALATTTMGMASSAGTVNTQSQTVDTQIGTVETVSSATATAILAYSTLSGVGGIINMQIVSRATTNGTGVVVGNTAAANYTLTFSNIAGTVALSTAGITLVGTAQTTNATFTAPVLTATIATNVITIKVANVALCTVDSQLVADIVLC